MQTMAASKALLLFSLKYPLEGTTGGLLRAGSYGGLLTASDPFSGQHSPGDVDALSYT